MAVLRGGKRIGPFDLRIGISRGREYENIGKDPRLKQRANPETTINRFRAALSQGEGLARPARFMVQFSLPKKTFISPDLAHNLREQQKGPPSQSAAVSLDQQLGRRISLMCNKITFPERQFGSTP